MSDDFAAGMRRAADHLRKQADIITDKYGKVLLRTHAAGIEHLAAIPAPAPWTPPEDRPDGFECLGQVGVELLRVKWNPYTHWNTANDTYHGWFTVRDSAKVRPTAFAPLPPAPEAQQ